MSEILEKQNDCYAQRYELDKFLLTNLKTFTQVFNNYEKKFRICVTLASLVIYNCKFYKKKLSATCIQSETKSDDNKCFFF